MELIRGESFPLICDKVLVYYDSLYCDPFSIEDGDIVYCDTHHILKFKEILNKRKNLTIVTHNSDHCLYDGRTNDQNGVNVNLFECYSRWFGQNSYSSNVIPLPIGFENKRWEMVFGPKTEMLNKISQENIEPSSFVYFNCNKNTNLNERQNCYLFSEKSNLVNVDDPNLTYDEYLRQIKRHKFVFSPRGNGLDCHRTWEVLFMKRVPILKREGSLEKLYENLPVLFVENWDDINNMDLENVYSQFNFDHQEYLKFDYWKISK